MKKRILTFSVLAVLVFGLFWNANLSASASPNRGSITHPNIFYFDGYVQVRPSYNENGRHAGQGYLHFWNYSQLGKVVNDTGRLYTELGISQEDSRILSRSHRYYDNLTISRKYKAQGRYGFVWFEHMPYPYIY